MSKKESANNSGNNVVALVQKCISEDCKKRPEVAGFCEEHFTWFKEGLITKEGKKPSDFEKKLVNFMHRRTKKKAS